MKLTVPAGPAAAGTLTGTALASNVVDSSLKSINSTLSAPQKAAFTTALGLSSGDSVTFDTVTSATGGYQLDAGGNQAIVGDGSGGIEIYFGVSGTHDLHLTAAGTIAIDGVTFAPITPDTGWTANADGGTKTSVIGSTATIAGMTAALNVVLAGFGTQFAAVAEKVKALEAVGVASKLPNA